MEIVAQFAQRASREEVEENDSKDEVGGAPAWRHDRHRVRGR
jgi:hypothetical protein